MLFLPKRPFVQPFTGVELFVEYKHLNISQLKLELKIILFLLPLVFLAQDFCFIVFPKNLLFNTFKGASFKGEVKAEEMFLGN